jgi:hypothetical protein
MRKKFRVNWKVVEYVIRKGISKFGYVTAGMFILAMVEYAVCWETVVGLILGLALGVCATLDLEDPSAN